MFLSDDTIVAIATPLGRGALGVIRVSGPDALQVASRVLVAAPLSPRLATLTRVRRTPAAPSPSALVVDEVIATWFPAPRSYTGEHVVEISAHGSPVVLRGILGHFVGAGARLARPGEFTFRAFLNGRIDLVQAEAVADLIDAATPLQVRQAFDQLEGTLSNRIRALSEDLLELVASLEASLDFPEEGYHFIEPDTVAERLDAILFRVGDVLSQSDRGRVIRDGATVVITGPPNVGKSSLFNALIGQERAIVTEIPGTTRDLLTERVELDGLSITLVDTAGVRESTDLIEQHGVERATRSRDAADLLLVVIDSGEPLGPGELELLDRTAEAKRLVVASKADRESQWAVDGAVRVSVLNPLGLDDLRRAIVLSLTGEESLRDGAALSNLRHVELLRDVENILRRARSAVGQRAPEEFALADLHQARARLAEVVGLGASDEVLEHIFAKFCIGK
jgi:tRNA modification GTPase